MREDCRSGPQTYLEYQVNGRERSLAERFQQLADIVPPRLASEAETIAEGWRVAAFGDRDAPPCEKMRDAYGALGEWLQWQAAETWMNPAIPLDRGLDGKIEKLAMKWQRNEECGELRLGLSPPAVAFP